MLTYNQLVFYLLERDIHGKKTEETKYFIVKGKLRTEYCLPKTVNRRQKI